MLNRCGQCIPRSRAILAENSADHQESAVVFPTKLIK